MPRPISPLKLIYSPGGHFPYSGWEDHVRTYQYFRVHGFNEFRNDAGIRDASLIENDELVNEAKAIVQRDWGKYLPPSCSNKDGIQLLGRNQVRRVRKRKPVAFQSACVAIVALELALKNAGSLKDIYNDQGLEDPHNIAICPCLFRVDEYDQKFYETNILSSPTNRSELVAATLQRQSYSKNPKDNVFLNMAKGQLVTEWLAEKFLEFWRARNANLATISVCKPRMGNGFRKPSELEVQVFPLS